MCLNIAYSGAKKEDSYLIPEIVEIRQLIWKIVQTNKAMTIKKNIIFEMQIDPSPKYLIVD